MFRNNRNQCSADSGIRVQLKRNLHNNPLSEARLLCIFHYLLDNFYNEKKHSLRYFTNSKMLEMLEISSGDYNIIATENFKYSDLYSKDATNQKKKRNEKLKKRNQIENLLKQGHKYQYISNILGVSISTISRVSNKKNVKNKIKDLRPWESLGISRSTYYRKYK